VVPGVNRRQRDLTPGTIEVMKTLLNVIWFLLAGWELALAYFIAGVLLLIPIVTIPFAVASFRIGAYALWPFGRTVVDKPTAGAGSAIGNVLWVILAGWWLALAHIITAIPLFLSIIGIPLALANLKMIPVSLMPLGKATVRSDAVHPAYERYPAPRSRPSYQPA
jgi:uncharacterized membrane protein YccF (DUF307 family)